MSLFGSDSFPSPCCSRPTPLFYPSNFVPRLLSISHSFSGFFPFPFLKAHEVKFVLPSYSWLWGLSLAAVSLPGSIPWTKWTLPLPAAVKPVAPHSGVGLSAHLTTSVPPYPVHVSTLSGLNLTRSLWMQPQLQWVHMCNCHVVFRKEFPWCHPLPLTLTFFPPSFLWHPLALGRRMSITIMLN